MNRTLPVIATLLGLLFLLLAVVYWVIPAQSLPGFLPGYQPGVSATHFKHGLVAAILGLALLAFGWFQKRSKRV